jgi:hypothetical protein
MPDLFDSWNGSSSSPGTTARQDSLSINLALDLRRAGKEGFGGRLEHRQSVYFPQFGICRDAASAGD